MLEQSSNCRCTMHNKCDKQLIIEPRLCTECYSTRQHYQFIGVAKVAFGQQCILDTCWRLTDAFAYWIDIWSLPFYHLDLPLIWSLKRTAIEIEKLQPFVFVQIWDENRLATHYFLYYKSASKLSGQWSYKITYILRIIYNNIFAVCFN